jgi:hypothetical protein
MKYLYAALLFLLLAGPVSAYEFLATQNSPRQIYSSSDSLPDTKMPNWEPYDPILKHDNAEIWFTQDVEMAVAPLESIRNPIALAVKINGVYDFYWDGQLIGSNTILKDKAPQFSRVYLPISQATSGVHRLTLKIKATGLRAGESLDLQITPALVKASFFGIHSSVISTFFVAFFAVATCLYIAVLWFSGAKNNGLASGFIVSLSVGAVILLEEGRHLFNYSYLQQMGLDQLLPVIAITLLLALPWYVLASLDRPNKWWGMLVVPAALFSGSISWATFEQDVRIFASLALFLALLSLKACVRLRSKPAFFAAMLAAAVLAILLDSSKHWFLIFITVLVASDLGYAIRSQAVLAQTNALRSERLRVDLLKRNIQPHFLMNSLTALMEWVETTPNIAVEFIEGLAEEFRILCVFAERKTVTLGDELELCETHLKLMGLRLDGNFSLQIDVEDSSLGIPPAIIHTLMENAFSHNQYANKETCFTVSASTDSGKIKLTFSAPVADRGHTAGTGTGSRYITARLTEFSGNDFTFTSEQVGSNWVTTITIPNNS